jgi:hypothetical protein
VKVKFDFTLDDLVDGAERAVARSPTARSWRWQGMLTSCLISAAIAYVAVAGSPSRRLFAAAVGALICAAIYPFSVGRSRKRRLRKYFREQFGGEGPYACEVELMPAGLVTVQAGTRSERVWSTITAIQVTDDSVDFLTKGAGSVVVRNRAFSSAEQRDAFVSLARSYAPKGA